MNLLGKIFNWLLDPRCPRCKSMNMRPLREDEVSVKANWTCIDCGCRWKESSV